MVEMVRLIFFAAMGIVSFAYAIHSLCSEDMDFSNVVIILTLLIIDTIIIYLLQ